MAQKVLYGVLDWGLGHATRSIPVIQNLILQKNSITIACSGKSLVFLKEYFPTLHFINFEDKPIEYSDKNSWFSWWKISIQMAKRYLKERKLIQSIGQNYDKIISDNRYGLFSKQVHSVFITHQYHVIVPRGFKLFQKPVNYLIHKKLQNFNEIWIPDNELQISGKLSEFCRHNNSKRIGLLSRFSTIQKIHSSEFSEYQVLVLLSGPEPQRTLLQNILISKLEELELKTLIIAGRPEKTYQINSQFVNFVWHLNDEKWIQAVDTIPYIIARAGYSTIMDLVVLKKTALLVPTPNQAEQEYLAKSLSQRNLFVSCLQNKILALDRLPEINFKME
jgi:uncharacterized protein (TIGR00661 family)